MDVDTTRSKPAKAERLTVLRDGKLISFWVARISLPGLKPVWIARDGAPIEFETAEAANAHAKDVAAKWRAEPARV